MKPVTLIGKFRVFSVFISKTKFEGVPLSTENISGWCDVSGMISS
jgi:hypothetical protein